MKSRRDTSQCYQSQTLKKIQNVQEFPLTHQCFTANSFKMGMEYHHQKYSTKGGRNSVEPKQPRSQRKSRESQMVEQKFYSRNEDIFQSRGNLPFERPEKNNSGRLIQQQAIRKIYLASKETNQAKDHFRSNGLIPQSSKQPQKELSKQISRMRKERHNSSPFLEELDRYIDNLDCQQHQGYQERIRVHENFLEEQQNSNRLYCSIEHVPTNRDIRHGKIIDKLIEQRKEKEMIEYKIETRDKKIKKMNQTAAHMLDYIRQLKGEIASTKEEKEYHIRALDQFLIRYENVRKNTAQQQNSYKDHQYHRNYDVNIDKQMMRPFQDRISFKQSSGKLKKRGLGNRNMNSQVYFKGRGSNRASTTNFYSYT